jgi:hypothetical protein
MALTPEVRSFIDILHEETRDAAWQVRVQESYEAAQATLGTDDGAAARAGLREVLRQNVDDSILEDVLAASEAESAEAFAQTIHERAQSWAATPIDPRLEVEIARNPRPLGPQFTGADPQVTEQIRSAAINGDLMALVAALLAHLGMQGLDADGTAQPGARAGAGAGPDAASGVINVEMTTEGQNLFNYINQVLEDGNGGIIYDPENPPSDGQLRISMTPAEMENALRNSIEHDIQAGTFPISGLGADDVDAIMEIISARALNRITADVGQDPYGNTYHSYDPSDNDLRAAVNMILTGDQAVVSQQVAPVIHRTDDGDRVMNADAYGDIFQSLVANASTDAQDVIEHFRPLVEGYYESDLPDAVAAQLEEARILVAEYTREDGSLLPVPADQQQALSEAQAMVERYADYQGQFVPPVINIPADKIEAFYAKIEEAFEVASRPNEDGTWRRDADAFGQIMAEDFHLVLPSGARESIRHDIYDHGEFISVRLGGQTENSIAALGENDAQLFEFANFMAGESFSVYGVRGDVNNPVMEEVIADIDNIDDVRALFGDEFEISVVSEPDFDLDDGNTNPVGYYISSANGNSFYIGFDAIPEETVSAAFREARARDADSQSREPTPDVDYSIGAAERPSVAEFNM